MTHIVPWLAPLVIASAALTGLILMMMKLMSLIHTQNRMIQSLTNLAASKDLAAFTTLESVQTTPTETMQYVPMDDYSVAERMAQQYAEGGMDPMHAYSQDDPLADFGGTEAFR